MGLRNFVKTLAKDKKTLSNKPTCLLTDEGNQVLFSLLKKNSVTLVTTIVGVHYLNVSGTWDYQFTGVACFERDSDLKKYFLRIYDIIKQELVFGEQVGSEDFWVIQDDPLLLRIGIYGRTVGLAFREDTDSWEESYQLKKALMGGINKKLKKEAQNRAIDEKKMHKTFTKRPDLSKAKTLGKKSNQNLSKTGGGGPATEIGSESDYQRVKFLGVSNTGSVLHLEFPDEPMVRQLFSLLGMNYEDAIKTQRNKNMFGNLIELHGGREKFLEALNKFGGADILAKRMQESLGCPQVATSSLSAPSTSFVPPPAKQPRAPPPPSPPPPPPPPPPPEHDAKPKYFPNSGIPRIPLSDEILQGQMARLRPTTDSDCNTVAGKEALADLKMIRGQTSSSEDDNVKDETLSQNGETQTQISPPIPSSPSIPQTPPPPAKLTAKTPNSGTKSPGAKTLKNRNAAKQFSKMNQPSKGRQSPNAIHQNHEKADAIPQLHESIPTIARPVEVPEPPPATLAQPAGIPELPQIKMPTKSSAKVQTKSPAKVQTKSPAKWPAKSSAKSPALIATQAPSEGQTLPPATQEQTLEIPVPLPATPAPTQSFSAAKLPAKSPAAKWPTKSPAKSSGPLAEAPTRTPEASAAPATPATSKTTEPQCETPALIPATPTTPLEFSAVKSLAKSQAAKWPSKSSAKSPAKSAGPLAEAKAPPSEFSAAPAATPAPPEIPVPLPATTAPLPALSPAKSPAKSQAAKWPLKSPAKSPAKSTGRLAETPAPLSVPAAPATPEQPSEIIAPLSATPEAPASVSAKSQAKSSAKTSAKSQTKCPTQLQGATAAASTETPAVPTVTQQQPPHTLEPLSETRASPLTPGQISAKSPVTSAAKLPSKSRAKQPMKSPASLAATLASPPETPAATERTPPVAIEQPTKTSGNLVAQPAKSLTKWATKSPAKSPSQPETSAASTATKAASAEAQPHTSAIPEPSQVAQSPAPTSAPPQTKSVAKSTAKWASKSPAKSTAKSPTTPAAPSETPAASESQPATPEVPPSKSAAKSQGKSPAPPLKTPAAPTATSAPPVEPINSPPAPPPAPPLPPRPPLSPASVSPKAMIIGNVPGKSLNEQIRNFDKAWLRPAPPLPPRYDMLAEMKQYARNSDKSVSAAKTTNNLDVQKAALLNDLVELIAAMKQPDDTSTDEDDSDDDAWDETSNEVK